MREERNLTQQQLASKAELTTSTVQRIERGGAVLRISLIQIARALGTTADKLVLEEKTDGN